MGKQQFVDFTHVKLAADFAKVLSHYGIAMPREKTQFKVSCPFHNEEEPSLSVNVAEKKFKCFGCDAKGSVLDFVARMEGCDLRQAAIKLAEICGCDLATPKTGSPGNSHRKAKEGQEHPVRAQTAGEEDTQASEAPKEPQEAAQRKPKAEGRAAGAARSAPAPASARSALASEEVNPPLGVKLTLDPKHAYLGRRGLSAETIATFGLGYCSRGLLRGRIAIPIHDERGELVAYAGRWPADEGWPEGEGKYKLPAKFRKSEVLFNLHQAGEGLLGEAILVEGFFSVFRLWQHGIKNVVALMGREISEKQEKLLYDEFLRITLLLDNDAPGREATASLLRRLSRRFYVRVPELPEGKSPDDLTNEELRALNLP